MSLVNPADPNVADREFQRYLTSRETPLFRQLGPPITAAIRLQVTRSSIQAQDYLVARGGPILFKAYRRISADMYRDVDTSLAKSVHGIFKADDDDGTLSDFLTEQLLSLQSRATRTITGIAENLSREIFERVMALVQDGEPTDVIAREIRAKAPEISKPRSAAIARTETHNSALDAIDETLKYKRIRVRTKQWWSAQDTRVRPTHALAHGQKVPKDEPFEVGDYQMMRPGDSSLGAGAEEIVNCRCAMLQFTETSAAA